MNVLNIPIGEIFKTTSGGTPSRRQSKYYYGDIPWVKSGELEDNIIFDVEEKITQEAIRNSSTKVFPKGTLLIALYGANIGKLGVLGIDAATNQAICAIFDNGFVLSKYAYYFLFYNRRNLISLGIGGAQPNISQDIVRKQLFPLIPYEEQGKIVSIVEEILSDLDNAIENFRKAQEQLKVYRQAVLKNAFEGRLTNVVKESNLKEIKINGLPAKLHSTQNVKRLGEYVKLQGGFAFKSKEYTVEGVPIVKITNVHYGDIDWSEKTFIDSSRYSEFKDYQLREGDVLVAMTRPIIKSLNTVKTVTVKKKDLPSLLNQRVGRFILNGEICRDYLRYFLYTDYFKQRVIRESSSTQQPNISSKDIEDFDFIIPENKTDQEMIIKEIESRFSVCDKLSETIENSLKQAEALRQSILKQAFEGKLTEQWRKEHKDLISGENSAEALLKKIKAEKEILEVKSKGKKKHD